MAEKVCGRNRDVAHVNACVTEAKRQPGRGRGSFQGWIVSNQTAISTTILAVIFSIHYFYSSLRPYTTPFLQLTHRVHDSEVYIQGPQDVCFIFSAILVFTAARATAINNILLPLARSLHLKKKSTVRFAEQGWVALYFSTFWSYGMYIWYNSGYWHDFQAMWINWPGREVSGPMKLYLVLQLSFWIQQIFIINIESKRKDHYQMLTHHIVTSSLLGTAYLYSFYNVANVVLCIMDIVDYMLPIAKMLRYLGYEVACLVVFAAFIVTWFIARHVLFMKVWWAVYKDIPNTISYGCYTGVESEKITDATPTSFYHVLYPFLDSRGPICMSPLIKVMFLSLLMTLQVLSLIWFSLILRIAYTSIRIGRAAEDSRSDGEEEDEADYSKETGAENSQNLYGDNPDELKHANGSPKVTTRPKSASNRSHVERLKNVRSRLSRSFDNSEKGFFDRLNCEKPA